MAYSIEYMARMKQDATRQSAEARDKEIFDLVHNWMQTEGRYKLMDGFIPAGFIEDNSVPKKAE
jgi:hypothetical protein